MSHFNEPSYRRSTSGEDLEFIDVPQDDKDDMNNMNYTSNAGLYNGASSSSGGGDGGWLSSLAGSKHPVTAIFHIAFKAAAVFFYMFGSWFTDSFIFVFVLCILLLAADFWTVKNVSGRLLVGLRWWSYVKPDGSNEWIFESIEDQSEISAFDSRIFWGGIYAAPVAWGILLVLAILRLKLEWLPLVGAALAMATANIVGYSKCSSSAQERMKNIMATGANTGSMLGGMMENSAVTGWLFNSILGGGGGSNSGSGGQGQSRDSVNI
jgi:hypothetical protein